MLLERLREYALIQLGSDLPPAGYQKNPVRYVIDLTSGGEARGVVDTASADDKRGLPRLTPHAKRAVGIVPKVLADTGEYVFGIPRNDPKKPANPERVADQHRQFREVIAACARDTIEPTVQAVSAFYDTFEAGTSIPQLPNDFDPSATITFRVGSTLPIDLPSVRAWWAASRAPDSDNAENTMTCIVCGQLGPVLERHPLKIKGIPGGQILKDLISANASAFESYGLTASMTAPTCPVCAEAYGNALNALLADRTTSMWLGGLAYAFWTEPRKPTGFAPVSMLARPEETAAEVGRLLTAYYRGQDDPLLLDPTRFYSVALGASGSRVVVKDWLDTTVGHAQASIARYFALQQMVDKYGAPSTPMPMFWLSGATVRRKEPPPDVVTQSLMRLALHGTPLPDNLLYLAVRRNRAEQDVTRARAALIRMVLDRDAPVDELKEARMAGLDLDRTDPAYVCGRLLAIIDRIQWNALGNINSSVIDKFFGSASSNPASVFPILIRGAQFHLNKLRRDKPGARYRLELALEDTSALLDDYPATLNLKEQGLFALGFYHQRAHDRAAIATAVAARKAGRTDVETELAEEANP